MPPRAYPTVYTSVRGATPSTYILCTPAMVLSSASPQTSSPSPAPAPPGKTSCTPPHLPLVHKVTFPSNAPGLPPPPRGHQHGAAEFQKSWHFYNPVPAAAQNDIVSAPRGEHALLRRALSHGFSDKSMRLQEPLIARYIDLLVARLHERAAPDRPLNIMAWYNYTTFDVIGDLAFGEAFGCLEKSDYHPWVKAIFYLAGKPVPDVEKCKLMWDETLARPRAAW